MKTVAKTFLLTVLALVLAVASVKAADDDSYKFDFGAGIGMSGYLGDANQSNLFKHPGVGANLSFRWLAMNGRFAVRGLFGLATLSGNTSDWDNVLPDNAQIAFKSVSYDLQCRAEFNFFPFGIGETYRRLKRITPYIALGIGANLATCDGNAAFAPAIPMAFGVKYKVNKRFNLMAEFSMTKVFGDHVDGPNLSDLYQIKSAFTKNNDWVSLITLSFSYEFGPRCVVCHRQD